LTGCAVTAAVGFIQRCASDEVRYRVEAAPHVISRAGKADAVWIDGVHVRAVRDGLRPARGGQRRGRRGRLRGGGDVGGRCNALRGLPGTYQRLVRTSAEHTSHCRPPTRHSLCSPWLDDAGCPRPLSGTRGASCRHDANGLGVVFIEGAATYILAQSCAEGSGPPGCLGQPGGPQSSNALAREALCRVDTPFWSRLTPAPGKSMPASSVSTSLRLRPEGSPVQDGHQCPACW